MNEPVFLSREAVDLIHEASLQAYGGADGVRDENALESALAQPMQEYFYRDSDLIRSRRPTPSISQRTNLISTATNGPDF